MPSRIVDYSGTTSSLYTRQPRQSLNLGQKYREGHLFWGDYTIIEGQMRTIGQHKINKLQLISILLFFVCFPGCASKYMVSSSKYPQYDGEINQHVRMIKAEKQKIFHILTDATSFRAICPEGTIVTHESAPPYRVGSRIKTEIDHIFNLKWHSQVMEVVPGERVRLQFVDGFFAGGTEIWELESIGEFTRTTHTIIVKVNGFLKKFAWGLKVRRKHDNMVEIFLDNLKSLAE
jgi:hypothetical protein